VGVKVTMTAEARDYVEAHGGLLYVRPRRTRCCGGGVTILEVDTAPPESPDGYAAAGPGVWYRQTAAGEPGELLVELRGIWRKRPVAFWDGCAFKI
jgi:hypothetical protein